GDFKPTPGRVERLEVDGPLVHVRLAGGAEAGHDLKRWADEPRQPPRTFEEKDRALWLGPRWHWRRDARGELSIQHRLRAKAEWTLLRLTEGRFDIDRV